MKKNGASRALLAPDANGWRVTSEDGTDQTVKTLGEAAAALPAEAAIHLALPASTTLLERLTLPATDRAELAGMVELQLEKTLPYPIEEVTSDFEVIRQGENESTLLLIAAHTPQLDRLCEPLRAAARLPRRVTLFATHVAASCPADETVLCVWQEDEQLAVAVCENSRLSTAQTFPGTDAETLLTELPTMLLRAELEGVPMQFDSIRVEHDCDHLRPALAEYFGKQVEAFTFSTGLPEPASSLLPATWEAEQKRLRSSGRLRQRLQTLAFLYLLLVASAFVYLAWMKVRVRKLDEQIATTQPQLDLIRAQQARWDALQPAINRNHYTVEILRLVQRARPSNEVKFNIFDHNPTQFMIEGEAPSSNMALEYGEKLRAEKELSDFKLETPPPQILKDDRAKFRFFGKL